MQPEAPRKSGRQWTSTQRRVASVRQRQTTARASAPRLRTLPHAKPSACPQQQEQQQQLAAPLPAQTTALCPAPTHPTHPPRLVRMGRVVRCVRRATRSCSLLADNQLLVSTRHSKQGQTAEGAQPQEAAAAAAGAERRWWSCARDHLQPHHRRQRVAQAQVCGENYALSVTSGGQRRLFISCLHPPVQGGAAACAVAHWRATRPAARRL